MKRTLVVFITLGLFLLAGCASPAPTATPIPTATPTPTPIPISHIYAFGDSYSDNGNMKKLLPYGPPWELMWEGRASNGPTAVEVLATRLNVELTDYAVGGAKSGMDNVNPLPNTGGLGQIEEFETTLNGQSADPQALYFVGIGGNDFLENVLNGASVDNPALTDKVVDNVATGMTKLAQVGAKRFLVIPSFDIAAMPLVITDGYSDKAVEFQTLMNSKLSRRLDELKAQLKIEITAFDFTTLSAKIRKNPSTYGLTNVTDACQPWFSGVKPVCATPDQYYFWDEVHPTRRTHQIFGEAWAALWGK